ncbi:MORN repeat-containing protein [Paenibacillus sp. CAU 1782]
MKKTGWMILIVSSLLIVLSGCGDKGGEDIQPSANSEVKQSETSTADASAKEQTEEIEKRIQERLNTLDQQLVENKAKLEPELQKLQSKQTLILNEESGLPDRYAGDVVNNKAHGFGSLSLQTSSKNISYYVGQFADGLPGGVSMVYYNDDSIYVGEVKDGVLAGQGIYVEALFDEEQTTEYAGEFIVFDSSSYFEEYTEEPDAVTFSNGDFYKGEFTTNENDYDYSFQGAGMFSKGFGDANRFTFKGNFDNNKPVPGDNGYAKVVLDNGDIYVGQVVNHVPNGRGAILSASAEDAPHSGVYFGDVIDGKADGYGMLGSYIGQFSNGKIQGAGYVSSGDTEIRGLFDSEWNGIGVISTTSGYAFTGEFKKGEPYAGELAGDQWQYTGMFEEVNGSISSNGIGRIQYDDRVYIGEIADRMPDGEGVIQFSNGDKYVGPIQQGAAHGLGYYANASGNEYRGYFVEGTPQDPVEEDSNNVVADYLILSESVPFQDVSVPGMDGAMVGIMPGF